MRHTLTLLILFLQYKNNETGRVNAVWPGSSMHYQQVIEKPRYEDFNITYHTKNPWAHLGLGKRLGDRSLLRPKAYANLCTVWKGYTIENRKGHQNADCSPYLNLNNIDPQWHRAIGGDPEQLRQQVSVV